MLKIYARKFGINDRGCYLACALGGLAFFFFIVIVAMGASWPASRLRHNGPLHFCTTPPCLEAAADILGSQNSSYDPCTDFWDYSCRGWLTRQPIPPTRSRWSTLEELEYQVRVEKSRLIAMSSHEPSQFNSNEWKVDNFYQACMELGFVESDREKPLIKIINNLGGWEVLRSFNLYSWDSHRVLKRLHAEYYVNAFFKVEVVPDVLEPNRNIIRIGPDGLGMPHKSFYHRLPTDPSVQAYQTFLKDSAQLFGAASPDAHKFSIDMFNFEKRISEITPNGSYLEDPIKINNRMMVKDLHTMSINIPWLEILKAAYNDAQMTEETDIIVVSPQYVADIAVIMSTTDRGSLNNYLMWQLAKSYMPYLSKPFQEAADLYRKSLTGAQKPLERWEFCEITAERFFGHLMTSIYTKNRQFLHGGQAERQRVVKKLFDYLRHNIAKDLSVSSKYDFSTRRAAVNKLKNMTVQIGTPDFLMSRDYLKIMYKDLLVQKTDFFQNILYGVMFLRKREENMLVSPSEESRWLEALHALKVSYITASNKVIVPEVFLQSPLFHVGYPNSVNMGGLGVRMAEAILEGVLGRGLLFDSTGRLVIQREGGMSEVATGSAAVAASSQYASYSDPRSILEGDSKCVVDKYSQVGVDDPSELFKCRLDSAVHVAALQESLLTLEDILDSEKGIILPAMETFDPQSVFFLSYAQSLCSHYTDMQQDIDKTSGTSLLNQQKLLGVLTQLNEFHHFFYCRYDSSMSCGKVL